jgi:hypothetical protein
MIKIMQTELRRRFHVAEFKSWDPISPGKNLKPTGKKPSDQNVTISSDYQT